MKRMQGQEFAEKPFSEKREVVENPFAKKIYTAPFFTVIFGFTAVFYPEWSPFWCAVWLGILFICVAWSLAAKRKGRHRDARWRAVFFMIQVDAGVWLTAVPLWREMGQPLIVGVVLAAILVGGGLLSYRNRRSIMGELIAPQTALGRLGLIGGGAAGLFAFFLCRVLFTSATLVALLLALAGLVAVIIFQGFWVYVEEPGWKPPKVVHKK